MLQPNAVKRLEPLGKPEVQQDQNGKSTMGPGIFVIAILGCADGGSSCTPVATLPTTV